MGEGPGEFSWPNGYAVMRDGTTVVTDARRDALQLFDPSGTFIRMVREPDELGMTSQIQRDPRGGAVLTESSAMSMGRGGHPALSYVSPSGAMTVPSCTATRRPTTSS